MAIRRTPMVFAAIAIMTSATAASAEPVKAPLDGETSVGGVPVACTGIGETKLDPRWAGYAVRVEFSGPKNEYLANVAITLWDARRHELFSVSCEGPWILLNPAPGGYRIEGRLLDTPAKPRTASFRPPAKGQMRLVLQFKDAETSAPAVAAAAAAP